MKYTYLLIDLGSVLFPFLFSFHPRLRFDKTWSAFFPAVLLTGAIFIFWDMYFTHLKVWGFNPAYVTGVNIGNLPIEEILFFVCIPYACVFTYHCFDPGIRQIISKKAGHRLTVGLILASILVAVIFYNRSYTGFTFIFLAVILLVAELIVKAAWMPRFYLTYLVLLIPFILVNGLLTGTALSAPVVWYNPMQIIGVRLLTIPIEDVFYGMSLLLMNIMIYSVLCEWKFNRIKARRKGTVKLNLKQFDS